MATPRSDSLPMLPGGIDQQIGVLHRLLVLLESGRELDSEIEWPHEGQSTRVRDAVRRLGRVGLITREGTKVVPNQEARRWSASKDHRILIEIFHRHVAFIGELMAAIAENPRTLDDLLEIGSTNYGFRWETVTPIRQRINWLRVTGMITYFDQKAWLTENGRSFLARLTLEAPMPTKAAERSVSIPSAPPEVTKLLERASVESEDTRHRGASLYILGRQENGGRLTALRTLVSGSHPRVTRAEFAELCEEIVGRNVPKSSVRAVLDTANHLGLLTRISEDSWTPSPAAKEWLKNNSPLDLSRIIHSSIKFFGEVLEILIDTPKTAELIAQLSNDYVEGGLRVDAVHARLHLLAACGLVKKLTSKTYQITLLGKSFLRTLPPQSLTSCTVDAPGKRASLTSAVRPSAEEIASELEGAGRDSGNFERLERAVVAALNYLGLDAEHIGGNGRADGVVWLGVGCRRRTFAIDAKTSARGPVEWKGVDLEGLAEHRERLQAETTLLVGPEFHDRVINAVRKDGKVAIVRTGFLASVVQRQQSMPLMRDDLAAFFDPKQGIDDRERAIQAMWKREDIRFSVERAVVDALLEEADFSEGWLTLRDLERDLRKMQVSATQTDIREALDFLSFSRIAAVEQIAGVEQKEDQFRIVVNRQTLVHLVQKVGRSWLEAPFYGR